MMPEDRGTRAAASGSPAGPASAPRYGAGPGPAARGWFHNPYNFIPALRRQDIKGELGDGEPVGHDRLYDDRWTGSIKVRLVTETPLLIPDAARAHELERDGEKTRHIVYPVRTDAAGQPHLPPTSVKGVLRSAYEAVTNSRLSVFVKHDAPLAHRMAPQQALRLVPARIESGADGGLVARLLPGTSPISAARPQPGGLPNLMYAAWLAAYRGQNLAQGFKTGDEVWFVVREVHRPGRFRYWEVTAIRRIADPQPSAPSGGQVHRGWVLITNRNIGRKHDERVFFVQDGHPQSSSLQVPLASDVVDGWRKLIANYRAAHTKSDIWERRADDRVVGPEEYVGHEPGKTAWSPHIYQDGELRRDNREPQQDMAELHEGCLCYAQVEPRSGGFAVTALYPVSISRALFSAAPIDLLHESLWPAGSRTSLSPADRVFGWVNPKGRGAHRGQLRIGPVRCETPDAVQDFGEDGVPLAILGQPKPQQARFYVSPDAGGAHGSARQEPVYQAGGTLRGRKVYPHHSNLPQGYWSDPQRDRTQGPCVEGRYQEYRRPRLNGDEQRDTQNRSILGWVKPGVAFTFQVDVSNLSGVELGALLWLLQLPQLPHGHFYRLGGGKPLGFGSVTMEVAGVDLRTGEEWCQAYLDLKTEPRWGAADNAAARIDDFKRAVVECYGKQFDTVPFIAAFLHCAQGFADGAPVHYPRTLVPGGKAPPPPDPKGESFKWFVENERGPRLALPTLDKDKDSRLPILEERQRGPR